MLKLVRLALKWPYASAVLALLITITGSILALRMPADILPDIRIPVISVVWQYTGLAPDQMAGRVTTIFQRALTTTVNDIEHIEAQSISGFGITKIFFQPGVNISTANAQVTAIAQTMLRQLPAGMTPPFIINYNASTVPIIQLALAGQGLSEQQLADLGLNTVRPPLISVPGAGIPLPFGGKSRQVQIDIDPVALRARGLSSLDVNNALVAQNLITPVGTQKIGSREFNVQLDNAPSKISEISDLPILTVDGATVYIRDVATVRDGNPPQTNIVHVDGDRSVLMTVLKNGSSSTLGIISGIKQKLAESRSTLPDNLQVRPVGDQSFFVEGAISSVATEGLIAAALTSLMILIFLGSWRSTLIIATSIPLAVLCSITALSMLGETLNIMTLGGLALAIGILVDDATVTIENINWHLEQGKELETAIIDGAQQVVPPAFVSMLCICIVFLPMFFLDGVARFLFVPMAQAIIFAIVSSFLLSRTLVPVMAKYLLGATTSTHSFSSRNPLVRTQQAFEIRFERLRGTYETLLDIAIHERRTLLVGMLVFAVLSSALIPFLGRNFFPVVDSDRVLIHVRAPTGTRIENTAALVADIIGSIRQTLPADQIDTVVDNIGLSPSGINVAYYNTGTIGSQDADIQVSLKAEHLATSQIVHQLREKLPEAFPEVTFSFPPADIISQILNFGSPAPIELDIRGMNQVANFQFAQQLLRDVRRIPGVVDARVQQSLDNPGLKLSVDRTRAQQVGVTQRDVTNTLVVNLAGSNQVTPSFWLNPDNGISYPIVIQTPQYELDSISALLSLPIVASEPGGAHTQILGGLATVQRQNGPAVVSQYNLQPTVQIFATLQGRDLASVAHDIRTLIASHSKDLPRGSSMALIGQIQTMEATFSGLLWGLAGAIALVYLLIVINFQSWTDAFVIVCALPLALAGIVWMLFTTHTPLSVPALTGAIMCMGVATANSILVMTFCRERFSVHGDPWLAAKEAGVTRFRPVLMTALAMIIGMLPMALGLGDGGEQNAPLGLAVIGGLLFATIATLFLVPVMFYIVRSHTIKAGEPSSFSKDATNVS